MFLLKLRFKWAKLQVHNYCSSKDMRGQSFALSKWKSRKSQNLMIFKGLTWPKFWKKISKNAQISPNISFFTQKLAKKHFLGKFEIFHTSV